MIDRKLIKQISITVKKISKKWEQISELEKVVEITIKNIINKTTPFGS